MISSPGIMPLQDQLNKLMIWKQMNKMQMQVKEMKKKDENTDEMKVQEMIITGDDERTLAPATEQKLQMQERRTEGRGS